MKWRRKTFKSKKRKNIERRKRTIIGVSILLGIAALIIGSSYVSALSGMTIGEIEVEGAEVVDEADIQETVQEVIDGQYFWLYARANALIYPKGKVRRTLEKEFRRIKNVEVNLDSMDVLHISITEREPYGLWCGEEYSANTAPEDEECSFLDDEGVIYAPAPSFSGDVFLRLYGERSTSRFLTSGEFDRLHQLFSLLEGEGIMPTLGIIRPGNTVEITVGDPFGYSSVLFVDLGVKAPETVRNLLTLYNELTSVRGENRKDPHLEYVDLRFGNRVFYNFADDTPFTAPEASVQ